jgi:hypothetical protein
MTDFEAPLRSLADAEEIQVAAIRPDGTSRPPRPIWIVEAAGDLYVRAAYGEKSAWWRIARESGKALLSVGDVELGVTVSDADAGVQDEVDAAYRRKYGAKYASIAG